MADRIERGLVGVLVGSPCASLFYDLLPTFALSIQRQALNKTGGHYCGIRWRVHGQLERQL